MGTGPARSGRRNTALLVQESPAEEVAAGPPLYVTCARPLRVGAYILPEGVEVPGAGAWLRVEAWVNARCVRKLAAGEPYIPFEVFEAWVNADEQGRPSLEEFHAQFEPEKIEDAATKE
jgi:hypothetical protein